MQKSENMRTTYITSMIIFGTIGLFVRNIDLSSGEIALHRAVLATLLIGTYFLIAKKPLHLKTAKKEIGLLFLSGVAMGFNWIFLFEAYRYTTVAVATLSYYFAPVIVMIASPVLFREKITAKQWICFTMATVGIVLITGIGDLGQSNAHMLGILFGLGAACFYAMVILMNKFIPNVEGIERTFWQFIAAMIVLIPYVFVTGGWNLDHLEGLGWICLLTVGLFHTGITYCIYFTSLKNLKGQQAAILSYIDPFIAVIISIFILGESFTFIQGVGGTLILAFTLLSEIDHIQILPERKGRS